MSVWKKRRSVVAKGLYMKEAPLHATTVGEHAPDMCDRACPRCGLLFCSCRPEPEVRIDLNARDSRISWLQPSTKDVVCTHQPDADKCVWCGLGYPVEAPAARGTVSEEALSEPYVNGKPLSEQRKTEEAYFKPCGRLDPDGIYRRELDGERHYSLDGVTWCVEARVDSTVEDYRSDAAIYEAAMNKVVHRKRELANAEMTLTDGPSLDLLRQRLEEAQFDANLIVKKAEEKERRRSISDLAKVVRVTYMDGV